MSVRCLESLIRIFRQRKVRLGNRTYRMWRYGTVRKPHLPGVGYGAVRKPHELKTDRYFRINILRVVENLPAENV